VVVNGLALGMLSTVVPIIVIAVATLIGYHFSGMYGVATAAMGMLSILGITLAVDSYGPVADNAGGIAEMAHLSSEVREVTDKLDAVGNTTAAIGKGFAIGSAAFAALGLITAYLATINAISPRPISLSLTDPMLVAGQGSGGGEKTVQGDSRDNGGKGKGRSQQMCGYSCPRGIKVDDVSGNSRIGIGFSLGPVALGGFLVGALVVGLPLGIQTANSGAAMDNAKKYIEEGNLGGKGSEAHKASVVGDTVGDPLKDTVGPSINILIKLMSVISLVLAPIIMALH